MKIYAKSFSLDDNPIKNLQELSDFFEEGENRKICFVKQSLSGKNVFISVWYEEW